MLLSLWPVAMSLLSVVKAIVVTLTKGVSPWYHPPGAHSVRLRLGVEHGIGAARGQGLGSEQHPALGLLQRHPTELSIRSTTTTRSLSVLKVHGNSHACKQDQHRRELEPFALLGCFVMILAPLATGHIVIVCHAGSVKGCLRRAWSTRYLRVHRHFWPCPICPRSWAQSPHRPVPQGDQRFPRPRRALR